MQCSSEATYINTNKKTSGYHFNDLWVHFEVHFLMICYQKACFFADVWSWKPHLKKRLQNDPKSYARYLQKGGSFSNKFVEKTVAKKDIVFNSSKNQFFDISSGFRGRRRDQFWHCFVKNGVIFEKGWHRENDDICKEIERFATARASRKQQKGEKKRLWNLVFFR